MFFFVERFVLDERRWTMTEHHENEEGDNEDERMKQ